MVPRPLRPSTPEACASSTIIMAPWRSAASVKPGSAPMSPSMENTPSVINSLRPGTESSSPNIFSAAEASLCGNTWILARERRQPSMMLAWFSSSLTMWSSGVRIAATVPALAAKPDWKTTHASTFLKAAMRSSPTPNLRIASSAASRSLGCVPRTLRRDGDDAVVWKPYPQTLARFSGGSRPVGSFGRSLGNEVGEKGLKDVTGVYNRVGHEAKWESWLKTILGRNHAVTGGCAMRIQLGLFVLCELVCAVPQVAAQSGSSGIVISQVYGGGGNFGTTLRNDFIELINRGSTQITVTGWSVQYASATGTAWDRTLLSGAIQPGQYYLIQEAQGNGGSASLPAPDLAGGINLSATDGKIALVKNSTALDGAAPSGSQIIDFVGYGGAYSAEGSPVAALDNTTAAIRKSGGCSDTNNNRVDFSLGSPAPRNSHSPTNLCSPLPSKPDLVVTALAAPTSGTVGGTLTPTSMTVKNQGGTAAGQFRVGYYLSPSAGMTSSAVYTGTYCSVSNGLAASTTFNCSNSIGIPSSLSPGTWYLLALADDQGQVDESDKTNNLRASDGGAVTLTGGAGVGQPCGVERWPVKTGTDADAKLVNLNNVTPTTIANLTTLAAPSDKPENNRVQPTETTLFVLNATLTEYKLEDDSDYHLIFSDSVGKTMIAEVPSPYYVGSGSPFAAGITNARADFVG